MKKYAVVFAMFFVFCFAAHSGASIINTNNDWGNSDGQSDQWGYICEIGSYEAFFAFDLSSIGSLTSLTFTANMSSSSDASRTLWAGSTLIGSIPVTTGGYSWQTFNIDLAALNWLGEDTLTLMLSGPASGDHLCGRVLFLESGNSAYLTANASAVPLPSALLLFGPGLAGLAALRRRLTK